MKLLILGGTLFLGLYITETALNKGHEITLFNRGKTNPDLFPDVKQLRGDRNNDPSALIGKTWDAVIDTSGYFPHFVENSVELLKDAVKHYTFISSTNVYADYSLTELNENSPVHTGKQKSTQLISTNYGLMKVLCEQTLEQFMPNKVLHIRPGLIVGPHDPSGRFVYWIRRIEQGGEVLAPDKPHRLLQFIDARDLAQWLIEMVEAKHTGVYNAVGPNEPITMEYFLESCKQVTKSDAHFTWISESFLMDNKVKPWADLPLWIPQRDQGLFSINNQKALKSGLRFRSLEQTILDTFTWAKNHGQNILSSDQNKLGLNYQREQELLKGWHRQ